MMVDPIWIGALEGAAALRAGKLTARSWAEALLARIAALDAKVNAFIQVTPDRALAAAEAADRELADGRDRGPLHGVPYGLKDIIDVAGLPTTCHSKLGIERIAEQDAAVTRHLTEAGAVMLGKLSTHEFAIGGPSFDLPWPPARNPWDLTKFPGGSSSGSGAGLAAGFFPLAVGTDTAGSIRNPAAQCGIVGFKPTYDRVSRAGVYPLAWSLDAVGPMARCVADVAAMVTVMANELPRPLEPASLKGLRVGAARCWHQGEMTGDPAMIAAFEAALARMAEAGAEIVEVSFAPLGFWQSVTRVILSAEGFAAHEGDLATRPQDYGKLARTRLLGGAEIRAADYLRAQRHRAALIAQWDEIMSDVDVVACLSSLDPPPRIDDEAAVLRGYLRQARAPANLLGVPAINLPTGFDPDGMPTSMQLMARRFHDDRLLEIAASLEFLLSLGDARPALKTD